MVKAPDSQSGNPGLFLGASHPTVSQAVVGSFTGYGYVLLETHNLYSGSFASFHAHF